MLLVGAGLLARSFINLVKVDPGFDARNALTVELHIWDSYPAPAQQVNFFDELFGRLRALPGTRAVGAASSSPFHDASQEMERIFTIESEPAESSGHSAFLTIATDGYFEAIGTPILEGRSFRRFDGTDSNRVAIITESLATRYWESGAAVGGRIRISDGGELSIHEVVGIVPDARHTGLDMAPRAEIFVPLRQNPFGSMIVVLGTDRDPLGLAEAAREQIWAIQPDQSVGTVATIGQFIDRTLGTRRFYLFLIGLFRRDSSRAYKSDLLAVALLFCRCGLRPHAWEFG